MRSVRKLLMVAATILALVVVVPSALASTPHTLTITKECSKFAGTVPSYCTITTSNIPTIPAGTKVWYYGPVVGSSVFVSSSAVITVGSNTATGYCQVDNRAGLGMCTFWKGTGTLAGFHAVLNVSVDATGLWHWDGKWYVSGK